MSQTKQHEKGAVAAVPRTRKDWELFWRIIAGLMLLVVAWVAWVMYQITPRSVVTPLAYASQVKPIGTAPSAPGAVAPAVPDGAAVVSAPQPAAAANLAMDVAQEAARAGAHQASADVQATALEMQQARQAQQEPSKREGLRLATEISTPIAEKRTIPKTGKPGAAPAIPAAAGAAAKDRP